MLRNVLNALSIALLMMVAGVAQARDVRVPASNPVVTVTVPDSWSVQRTSRGVEIRTPDEEVFLWFEAYAPSEEKRVWAEHEAYFTGQGVTITGAPRTTEDKDPKATVRAADFPATWKGAPTVLRYVSIDAGFPGGKIVLMSVWASPEGDKAHHAAIGAIINSMR